MLKDYGRYKEVGAKNSERLIYWGVKGPRGVPDQGLKGPNMGVNRSEAPLEFSVKRSHIQNLP